MRRILAVAALSLGACAGPAEENVSLEGPTTADETTTTEPAETTTTSAPVPVEVGRWSGTAETDTPNFTVKESWELHWKVVPGEYGGGVGFEWKDPADLFNGGLLQVDEEEGKSLIREGGTFYFHISMYGAESWEVWAVDVPN